MYNGVMEPTATDQIEVIRRIRPVVLDSVTSMESKRIYGRGIDRFVTWVQSERPSTGFTKATVQAFRSHLIASGLSSSSINLYLTAIRRLAIEAADNGALSAEVAAAIGRVKGMKREGVRIGNWLTAPESESFINSPNLNTLKGKRDRALLAILIGCGLRRQEAASLTLEDVQEREGRSVIVDLRGKGRRIRSVPVPSWAKEALDDWTVAAGVQTGRIFLPVNKADRLSGKGMSAQSVFVAVKRYAGQLRTTITPHDLRRTFARLAHKGKAPIEQIQFSLGHASLVTSQRYVGVQQDLIDAPCDRLGLRLSSATGQQPPTTP
jgi:site-specific recombinase XerD